MPEGEPRGVVDRGRADLARPQSCPSCPNALRVFFGRWLIVFFDLAALIAFWTFFLAAARCFVVAMWLLLDASSDLPYPSRRLK
jgi:hypothetical protein